jgi:hypothetical protein
VPDPAARRRAATRQPPAEPERAGAAEVPARPSLAAEAEPQPGRGAGAADRRQCRRRPVDRQRRQSRAARHAAASGSGSPSTTRRAARRRRRKQALADGNRLFLGPLLAEDVRAVAPVARRAGVPVIAFSNDVSVAGDGVYLMGFIPASRSSGWSLCALAGRCSASPG